MGATVLTGKKAAAFQAADGVWWFALFARTYEKNCYPHDDKWSAFAFGTYPGVMRRVFEHASSCESGMLQSRAGSIKPENYISTWRSVLAKPFQLRDRTINLDVSTSYRAPLPESALENVRESLIRAGLSERAEEVLSGKAQVSLVDDAVLLDAIYGENGPLSLWRVLDVGDCSSLVADVDLHLPKLSTNAMDRMPNALCYKIDDENRLVSLDGRPLENVGWQYAAVGGFITDIAYQLEMETPGFAKTAIPAYRQLLSEAGALPAQAVASVARRADGIDQRYARDADELAVCLGLADAQGIAPDRFSFEFGNVLAGLDGEAMRRLCGLHSQQVTWSVPDPAGQLTDGVLAGSCTDLTQLLLELV